MHPFISFNNVKSAVRKAGGATIVASTLGVSGTTIHNWVRQNNIPNFLLAKSLAQMSGFSVKDLRSC